MCVCVCITYIYIDTFLFYKEKYIFVNQIFCKEQFFKNKIKNCNMLKM